jgi:hypothetical protein
MILHIRDTNYNGGGMRVQKGRRCIAIGRNALYIHTPAKLYNANKISELHKIFRNIILNK